MILGALVLTLIVGILLTLSFLSKEDGTGKYEQLVIFTIIITSFLTLFLLILATSKMWFPHLWKRNSSHDRHKRHTQHHPSMRGRDHHNHR